MDKILFLALVWTVGCGGAGAAPDEYTETCDAAHYARHDFGTTDPGTLALVRAFRDVSAAEAATLAIGSPDGMQVTAMPVPVTFAGSVGVAGCGQSHAVTFVAE